MNDLLNLAIEAHGGLDRWRELKTITIEASIGGLMWDLKGKSSVLKQETITIDPHEQYVSYNPFGSADRRSGFRPDWVGIERQDGTLVEERKNPRDSFEGHTPQTPWDDLQLAYFSSYAIWGYLTAPFHFVLPGITTNEIEPWDESGETWRRLRVSYPSQFAVHSPVQTFYFDKQGFLRRLDYNVDISGGIASAQYTTDHRTFDGIVFPTRRRVHPRQADNLPNRDRLGVSIDIAEAELA